MPRNIVAFSAGALVAFLSIGGKLVFLGGDVRPMVDSMVVTIAGDLTRQGVNARLVPAFEGAMIMAQRDDCRMAIRPLKPSGDNRDLSERELSGFARHRFIYRGAVLDRAPTIRPYLGFQFARAANRLGIKAGWSPALSFADNGLCQAGDLPLKVEEAAFRPMGND